jgi:hypothetical protein
MAVIAAVNMAMVGWYVASFDLPFRGPRIFLVGVLMLSASALLAAVVASRWAPLLGRLQVSIFSVVLMGVALQAVHAMAPQSLPMQLRRHVAEGDVRQAFAAMVETLDHSPYRKLRAHTRIKTQGVDYQDADYVYEWTTDKRGFKNPPSIGDRDHVDVVAVGDSFTEGMGVSADDAWTAQLTARGFPTYNLGVQGYSPLQMEGALRTFGMPLRPRHALIAYYATTYSREDMFAADGSPREALYPFREFETGEIMVPPRFVVSGVYLWALTNLPRWRSGAWAAPEPPFQSFARDIARVRAGDKFADGIRSKSEAWVRTLAAFDRMIDLARQSGAGVTLVYIPTRRSVVYEAATGLPLPPSSSATIETASLREYAEHKGVAMVDTFDALNAYTKTLTADSPPAALPYFERDAHLNAKGHAMVAEVIATHLRTVFDR